MIITVFSINLAHKCFVSRIGHYMGRRTNWMDASGKEVTLWQQMLDRPNFWVEGSLHLRPAEKIQSAEKAASSQSSLSSSSHSSKSYHPN